MLLRICLGSLWGIYILSADLTEKYTFDSCNIYQRIGIHTLVIVVSEVCSDIYFSLGGYTFEISKVGGT